MSLADDLQKLEALRSSGALSEEEYQQAKARSLAPIRDNDGRDTLGKAANRFVSFQIVMAAVGIVIFLIMFFTFFLPMFRSGPSFGGPPPFNMPHP